MTAIVTLYGTRLGLIALRLLLFEKIEIFLYANQNTHLIPKISTKVIN